MSVHQFIAKNYWRIAIILAAIAFSFVIWRIRSGASINEVLLPLVLYAILMSSLTVYWLNEVTAEKDTRPPKGSAVVFSDGFASGKTDGFDRFFGGVLASLIVEVSEDVIYVRGNIFMAGAGDTFGWNRKIPLAKVTRCEREGDWIHLTYEDKKLAFRVRDPDAFMKAVGRN